MSTTPAEPTELTVRGIILGVLITLVFTAANVFFGLKAGLTFSTSIPAALISIAVLPRPRHPHGRRARFQGDDHPGKQYRPDGRLRRGNALIRHLHPAQPRDRGLVDRLSLLDLCVDLRAGRRPRRALLDSAAARARYAL